MIVAERVNIFIKRVSPDTYCDGCITRELGLTKPQHVAQITAALGTCRDFVREDGVCDFCAEERRVIRRA